MYQVSGSRICLRAITEDDADLIVRWRNTKLAHDSFFSPDVVTPDTHRAFVRNRRPHDLIWMVENIPGYFIVGMTSLIVDVQHYMAEQGRTFIDPQYQEQGYGAETEYTVLSYAFDVLRLNHLWLDAFAGNAAAVALYHKVGWRDTGIDLPGHTRKHGPVLSMHYTREDWPAGRKKFAEEFKVELETWEP